MNDIEILDRLKQMKQTFREEGLQGYELTMINTINLMNNLIAKNKDLEVELNYIKSLDINSLVEDWETGQLISKSKLVGILKQRLKKYQDADDGQYKQEYLTRGELELVDRYKECSELLKILCEEDIYKIQLEYIPKSKVKEILDNEIINISGFECIAKEDIEELLQ